MVPLHVHRYGWVDQCTARLHQEVQTILLQNLMEHFLATDILVDPISLPLPPGGMSVRIPNHICYFASRLVDKLWQVN
ncbi:unnamed protein product [Protopolystoma xenopodis]|uniref:Uncharacterized protein n=1 Tax=Protopolystoma xenopodis TaxID=117903 RepID=A0A448XJK9_9PLAT|nr:unnamed protein product [Protopolystoma xenopodis]